MAEKIVDGGQEFVRLTMDEYNELVDVVAAEKKEKDDFYRKRIEMAEQYVKDGKPSVTLDELFEYCKAYAREHNLKDVANG